MDFRERFKMIRDHYKRELPQMMAEYEKTGCMYFDPYELDFTGDMTPIEDSVWFDIRTTPVPMYPQIPALNYFLDFANPFVKVAIECDGKEWHDAEKDAKRDQKLIDDGWTIYRIPGAKCNRVLKHPSELECELRADGVPIEQIADVVSKWARDWFLNTSQGIVKGIAVTHFEATTKFEDFAYITCEMHRSAGTDARKAAL